MKTIFLFGHRDAPNRIWREIYAAAEECIRKSDGGRIRFIVGHRGNFDGLATAVLVVLKSVYPDITILQLIAYYDPTKRQRLFEEVDSTYYPEGLETVPKPFAIIKANQIMVDSCDEVICFVRRQGSNTYKLLRRAQRRGVPVVNLAERCQENVKNDR